MNSCLMKARPLIVARTRVFDVDDFVGAKFVDLLLDAVDVAVSPTFVHQINDIQILQIVGKRRRKKRG